MSKADLGFSEEEDDPYQSSGSEWNSEQELEPVRKSTRRSSRVTKKRLRHQSTSSSESDEDFEEDPKPRRKNGFNKKPNISVESPKTEVQVTVTKTSPTKTVNSKDFSTGSFLIAKKDANVGDPNKHPCIWRVDGKALLQKYEPFENDGKISHQTTSIYTGWSALDQDLYSPVSVTVKQHNNHNMIVDLNWEKLKQTNNESD